MNTEITEENEEIVQIQKLFEAKIKDTLFAFNDEILSLEKDIHDSGQSTVTDSTHEPEKI